MCILSSYQEYLYSTKQKDSPYAWRCWKVEVCGMDEREAIIASMQDYEPLPVYEAKLYACINVHIVNGRWNVERIEEIANHIPMGYYTFEETVLSRLKNDGWIMGREVGLERIDPCNLAHIVNNRNVDLDALTYLIRLREDDCPIGYIELKENKPV